MTEMQPAPAPPTAAGGTNPSQSSCSALDLSWLSETVMEAALETKNLSLTDMHHFHNSLKAAEDWGMDRDCSERLHGKIDDKEKGLMEKMVRAEFKLVAKRLQIYRLLKAHQTFRLTNYMADMHGQGAYILMTDFTGLAPEDVRLALQAFHTQLNLANHQIPYSNDTDKNARAKVQLQVAIKLCHTYQGLLQSLQDKEIGGYEQGFLHKTILYTAQDLMALWGVNPKDMPPPNDKKEEDEEAKMLGERTDDEDEGSETEGGTWRDDDDEDYEYIVGRH